MSHSAVKADPSVRALVVARAWFEDGRRVDMSRLAAEVGIGRATLYRWCTSREAVIGEVVWSVLIDAITHIEKRTPGKDADSFIEVFGRLADTVRSSEPLAAFIAAEPEYALRVLTTRYSITQARTVDWVAARLREVPDLRRDIVVDDLAYAVVRLGESFLWSDFITGDDPDPGKAKEMVRLLVSGARTHEENR